MILDELKCLIYKQVEGLQFRRETETQDVHIGPKITKLPEEGVVDEGRKRTRG